jgi:Uma2 family endonuclease
MEHIENHCYTLDEFEKIQSSTDCKVEYFNGEVVLHSKTSVRHNEIVVNIATSLKNYFKQSKCKVYMEQIEVMFHNDEDTVNVFPDVFVACEESTKKGESFASAPKIIFEVVSENYRGNDYIKKLKLYQKYGVLEYIIVEQSGEMIQYYLNIPDFLLLLHI